jgi:hypothetical protein
MPFQLTRLQLPCGAPAASIAWQATIIGGEDATELLRQAQPGGDLHGLPLLVLTDKASSLSPEARAVFVNWPDGPEGMAVVVTSAVMRVAINFILRVTRDRRVRLFTEEPQAIRWLDARARGTSER